MLSTREVERVADLSDDNDEAVRASIRNVQLQFADAKLDAERRFETIVDQFCDGQRKNFQFFLKARRMSDHSELNEAPSASEAKGQFFKKLSCGIAKTSHES